MMFSELSAPRMLEYQKWWFAKNDDFCSEKKKYWNYGNSKIQISRKKQKCRFVRMKRETGLLLHTQGWKPVSERLTRKVNFFEQWSVVERIETRSFVQNGVCVWNIKVLRSGILHSSCLHTRELNTDNSCGTVLSWFRCQTLNFIFREIPEKTFVLSSFQTAQNTNAWRVYELYFVYPAWEKGENQLLEQNLHIA